MRHARLFALLLGLAGPALAAPTPAVPIPIGGTVRDAQGKPVAGATAELLPAASPLDERRLAMAAAAPPSPLASARSDAAGAFSLTAPDSGLYVLVVRAAGSVPVSRLLPVVEPLELPAIALDADAGLSVRVLDAAGKPLPGARVRIEESFVTRALRFRREASEAAPRRATTGADGRVSLPRAAGEAVEIEAQAAGYAPAKITTQGRQATAEVRLAAGCPRSLEITAGVPAKPVAGVFVDVAGWTLGTTDDAGHLTVAAPCKEDAALLALADDGRQARTALRPPPKGAAAGAVRLALPALPPARSGRVLAAGTRQPIAGALAWIGEAPGLWARTDAHGAYTLPRAAGPPPLLGGRPSVSAVAAGYFAAWGELQPAGAAPTVVLKPAAALEGVVVDAGRKPVAGAVLQANAVGGSAWRSPRAETGRAKSGATGTFRLRVEAGSPLELTAKAAGFAPATLKLPLLAPHATHGGLKLVLTRGRQAAGQITDGAGAAIAGAEVELVAAPAGEGRRGGRGFFGTPGEESSHKATTGTDGRFALANLPGGRYNLTARAAGFAATLVRGLTLPSAEGTSDLGTVILQPGVALSGLVVDRGEHPIAGATVKLWPDARGGGRPRPAAVLAMEPADHETQSAADGTFKLADLSPGTAVLVAAQASGFASPDAVRVTLPAEAPVRLVLTPAARITGRVVDDGGDAVPSAVVTVTPVTEHAVGGRRFDFPAAIVGTDEAGHFTADGLEAGRFELNAQAQGYISQPAKTLELAAGRETPGVELVVTSGAVVEGQVLAADGTPVDGARVQVQPKENGGRYATGDSAPPMATSDGDGRFRLTGLAPGAQSLSAEHEGYLRAVKDVELRAGETGHVEMRLGEGLAVSGRVVDAGGLGVAGASVTLSPQGDFRSQQDWSGADGAFRFAGVTPGKLDLAASKEGMGTAKLDDLAVTDAPVGGVELRLAKGGAISGRILGLSYPELTEVQVRANGSSGGFLGGADIDFEGRYRLEGAEPGEWNVSARVPSNGRSASGKAQIAGPGAEATLDLEFGGGLTLAGRVLYGGQPLAGATVSARAEGAAAAQTGGSSAPTDAAGGFRIEGLKAGTYRLVVYQYESGVRYENKETTELSVSRDDVVVDIPGNTRVHGRVIEAGTQQPVAGADISFERQDGNDPSSPSRSEAGRTDSQGIWSTQAPPGKYRVQARKAGYSPGEATLDAGAGSEPPEVRITLSPAPGLTVAVIGVGGVPPATAFAALLNGAGQAVVSGSYAPGEEGRIQISEAPPGSFILLIGASGMATTRVPVLVPSATTLVTLSLPTHLTVSVPALADARDARLIVLGANGQPFSSLSWGGAAVFEHPLYRGQAEVDDLPAGSYTLTVTSKEGKSWQGAVVAAGGAVTQVLE